MHFGWESFRARSTAPVLALLFIVSGCGKGGGTEGTCRTSAPSFMEAQRQAKLIEVSCFSERDCHPGVAMLSAAWSDPSPGLSVCTGFLVAPDVLATNSHCLPGELSRPGASCSDRVWAFFPAMSGLHEEHLDCDTVLSNSGSSEKIPGQDIAFLKLKTRSSRPALALSHDGFADQQSVKLVKVNPEAGQSGACGKGVMQTVDCTAVQHSSRLPSFDDKDSPVVSLGVCEVMHGNSGGPVLDSHGRAVGIIQAFFNPSSIDPNSLLAGNGSSLGRLNVATSMACVQSPLESNMTFPEACNNIPGPDDDRHTGAWIAEVSKKMQADANATYAQSEAESPTGIRWKSAALERNSTLIPADSSNSQYDVYLVPMPECVGRSTRSGSQGRTIAIGHFQRGYDEFLVPDYKPRSYRDTPGTLTVTPSGGGAYVELAAEDSQGRSITYFQQTVAYCN